ncbi:EAL and modified HD-GYP domain-containing signal transduction protein [Amphritea atlantica]|uniref:EAL and modified HD-GYP domain-containing signal transduction protein n=1 Tax=Amphritea atlantica TaxID=355243 RepID=A0A1H9I437_9GAMM|nr:HDOD domain-containing protein [Amphritea atlantica]SEQ69323.1 EAL and modified HD-GYP domain-containing signal transduction protein [Amphritea atlantica]
MESTSDSQVLMARQPIFDRSQRVVAYELLYRDDQDSDNSLFRNAGSTSEVILNSYTSISDQGELKRVPAFINLNRDLLVSDDFPELPRKNIVLEVHQNIKPDREIITAIYRLVKAGYRIALDHFTYKAAYEPLLKMAHIVKVDVQNMSVEEVAEQVRLLTPFKVTLLAEKIQTVEMLEACNKLGFKLFQGHFLSKPKPVKGKKVDPNQAALFELVQELQNPNTTPERLEHLIIRDPVLTYKLLRIVNSAAYSLVRKLESLTEAIVMLGMTQIRKWATLIALNNQSGKPEEICRSLLVRGRMCEEIALASKRSNPGSYFMTGMMSNLHLLLDIDRESMLREVPLSDEIKNAILLNEGEMGETLMYVGNYEAGDWDLLPTNFDSNLYETCYRKALDWSKEAMQALSDID